MFKYVFSIQNTKVSKIRIFNTSIFDTAQLWVEVFIISIKMK